MSEQNKNRIKECILDNLWFKILSFVAIAMLIISLLMPPQGVIDPTVIGGVGEIFAFSALWSVMYALKNGKSAQITHGDTTVVIRDADGNMIEGTIIENESDDDFHKPRRR